MVAKAICAEHICAVFIFIQLIDGVISEYNICHIDFLHYSCYVLGGHQFQNGRLITRKCNWEHTCDTLRSHVSSIGVVTQTS